eukprot:gnl/MRDRNA2_/MRDRNA2_65794_c0_seq1.p1 gnl/MRDRNA2_/MRDRNA2_65794_c0~~gnl/MRDRNA2_/MRDRNA2_65794_c0_seq1.p1  ORF type:complete len:770 (-),score=131.39 gnl/MRDRNA2_/MRDRNA2_65794_c0_seq1:73-2382(-)
MAGHHKKDTAGVAAALRAGRNLKGKKNKHEEEDDFLEDYSMGPIPSSLKVWMTSADGIKGSEGLASRTGMTFGKADPYCVCEMSAKKKVRTQVMWDAGSTPVWDHGPTKLAYENERELKFSVYDKDKFAKDTLLGKAVIAYSQFMPDGYDDDMVLLDTKGNDAGRIKIKVLPEIPGLHNEHAAEDLQKSRSSRFSIHSQSDIHPSAFQTFEHMIMHALGPRDVEDDEPTHWFVDSKLFTFLVYAAIIANACQMGMATDYTGDDWDFYWYISDHLFTGLFTIEMFIKLGFLGKDYFANGWNLLDFFLVWMSIIDTWILGPIMAGNDSMKDLSILRMIRLLRIARLARLLKVFKELWMIIRGILDSLKTMLWVSMLLLLLLYTCSIMCVDMIGKASHLHPLYSQDPDVIMDWEDNANFNPYMYFGTILRSMYTLFNIVILTEFPEIGRPIIEKQPHMFAFFLVFIIFTTFGVMNVIIGVIVDNTMEAAKAIEEDDEHQVKQKKLALLSKIRDLVFAMDEDGSGTIDLHELSTGMKNPEVVKLLREVNLPRAYTPEELLHTLSDDGDAELRYSEVTRNLFRLRDNDEFQRSCMSTTTLNNLKRQIFILRENMASRESVEEAKAEVSKVRQAIKDIRAHIAENGMGGASPTNANGSEDPLLVETKSIDRITPKSATLKIDVSGSLNGSPTMSRNPSGSVAGTPASGSLSARNGQKQKAPNLLDGPHLYMMRSTLDKSRSTTRRQMSRLEEGASAESAQHAGSPVSRANGNNKE